MMDELNARLFRQRSKFVAGTFKLSEAFDEFTDDSTSTDKTGGNRCSPTSGTNSGPTVIGKDATPSAQPFDSATPGNTANGG